MGNSIRIESISQLHELIGYEKPKHPLITLIDLTKIAPAISTLDLHIITNFYTISLKEGISCRNKYGRQYYDFQEGSLTFMAPEQELHVDEDNSEAKNSSGWILCFHPDLIYKNSLIKKVNQYTFFSYDSNEALHLSDQEKIKITDIVNEIKNEFSQNIDVFSQDLIISYVELLLNHCKRFYGRQFITRAKVNKEVVVRFEDFLKYYFDSAKPESDGLPSVKYCALEMGYSPNYLSDLLKKETGKNTQEHIHFYMIEKAKNMLLDTEKPVNLIAAELGFEYPQHFSKLFKNKTGMSPIKYRN
ncbi:MAG: AraC family transcriptional regulator [Firmicutes bacterium HGW-Firmicutes-15]|nr:MAG: AraC family transcriptional regulator [Firmicutes bacterium HGW-Firmicutes-15]